ncbi:MAG: hypothetical protein IV090_20240, partial [Candidatus Sericytochromatia bacterium]|nr:hypothetical protein [Candidatus Sericytochromatia bacterium]
MHLLACFLPCILTACQFNPIVNSAPAQPATSTQQPATPAANPSVSTSSVSGFSKQSVTFHDKAKYQPLHFLQQLPKGKQSLPLRFVSKNPGKGKYTIRMPENTLFRVVFKAGPRFEILDNDARDGQAVVQMPTELREGYTRVRSPRSKELLRSLTLKDPLYKLTQELVRNDKGPGSFLVNANPPKPPKPTPAPKLKPLQLSSVCS